MSAKMLVSLFFSLVASDTTMTTQLLTGSDLADISLKYLSVVNRNTDGCNFKLRVNRNGIDYYLTGLTNIPVQYGLQTELNYSLNQYDKLYIEFDSLTANDIIDIILTIEYLK